MKGGIKVKANFIVDDVKIFIEQGIKYWSMEVYTEYGRGDIAMFDYWKDEGVLLLEAMQEATAKYRRAKARMIKRLGEEEK